MLVADEESCSVKGLAFLQAAIRVQIHVLRAFDVGLRPAQPAICVAEQQQRHAGGSLNGLPPVTQ